MNLQPFLDYVGQHVDISAEEQSVFLSKVKVRKYLKGQFVVQNGDICRHENFILSGCLKTFYIDNEGYEHIVMFAIENWWTSDLGSFITQAPADLNVQCLEDSELIQISYNDLQQLYIEIPKLERFFRIIIQNAFVAAQKRILNKFSFANSILKLSSASLNTWLLPTWASRKSFSVRSAPSLLIIKLVQSYLLSWFIFLRSASHELCHK